MPLNNVYQRPIPNGNDLNQEKKYFALWILMLSVENFLDPNTYLLNDPQGDATMAHITALSNAGANVNYLDLAEVAHGLNGVYSTMQISQIIRQCLGNYHAYTQAINDFASLALPAVTNLYPVLHGCTGTQSVLDVIQAPISPPGTLPH